MALGCHFLTSVNLVTLGSHFAPTCVFWQEQRAGAVTCGCLWRTGAGCNRPAALALGAVFVPACGCHRVSRARSDRCRCPPSPCYGLIASSMPSSYGEHGFSGGHGDSWIPASLQLSPSTGCSIAVLGGSCFQLADKAAEVIELLLV